MELTKFNHFQDAAHDSGLLFYYTGYFSQSIVTAMSGTLKHRLEGQGAKGSTARKVFSAFIEMAQNVVHYSAERATEADAMDGEIRSGTVAVGQSPDGYFVVCGNSVERGRVLSLRAKLDPICQMTAEEIKEAYKQQLRGSTDADSKGAGLGFLTVAREATAPIEYSFVDNSHEGGDTVFFYLKATI
jgi:hypothetical protein